MLSIQLIKYNKHRVDNPKTDEKWKKYFDVHAKRLRCIKWGNEYGDKYTEIQKFVGDPVYFTPLYIPNDICMKCFGCCRKCSSIGIFKAAKLILFSCYLDGVKLNVPKELEQLKKCQLFSIYMILYLKFNDD